MARHSGGEFFAYGKPSYVAGAALGYAIGEAVRTQQDFNDCMLASGWLIADETTRAAKVQKVDQLKILFAQRVVCIQEVRERPEYEQLAQHFAPLSGEFTIVELADTHVPTSAEAGMFARYWDDASACTLKFLSALSAVAPELGLAYSQWRSEQQQVIIRLVKRQITWGDAAQQQQKINDEGKAKLTNTRA